MNCLECNKETKYSNLCLSCSKKGHRNPRYNKPAWKEVIVYNNGKNSNVNIIILVLLVIEKKIKLIVYLLKTTLCQYLKAGMITLKIYNLYVNNAIPVNMIKL